MIFVEGVITARKNPTVMYASSLQNKKSREEYSAFIAEGIKLFCEAARANLPIESVLVCEDKKDVIYPIIEEYLDKDIYSRTKVYTLADTCFEKVSTEKSPQGVIVIIKSLDFFKSCNKIIEETFINKEDKKKTIALFEMRDPGNLGAVVRSAVAFGAERIILSEGCADVYNPKTIRAAMGSIFKVEILISDDMFRTVSALRNSGRRVYAAELRENAVSLDDIEVTKNDVVIIGNEGHGIPEALSGECDNSVYIPISENAESLNAAVAAAIFMREQK